MGTSIIIIDLLYLLRLLEHKSFGVSMALAKKLCDAYYVLARGCYIQVINICWLNNFKGLKLNGFSKGSVWKIYKLHESPGLAPAEALFV